MKKMSLKGKLSLSKSTISKFEMGELNGGGTTYEKSRCGTAMNTVVCCNSAYPACDVLTAVTCNSAYPACDVLTAKGC
jgi:hypothetical protein